MAEQWERPEALGGLLSRTKFMTPSVDDQVVVRPALRSQLLASIERHPLTVVAASAGAGKTTLLAQWVSAPGRWQPAWARLDAGDDDATMLAWTLVGCLRSLGSHSALRLEQVLASPGDTSPARLAHVS